ncbi:MAG TPA: hypothetical protein VKT51_04065 [Candidatus Eremiobacteraceae bacterium]|nr:hypothetical protein [Candidatus Eremiobacteraceae bacterium]
MHRTSSAAKNAGRIGAVFGAAAVATLLIAMPAVQSRADTSPSPQATPASPYGRVPVPGNTVVFDGTVGGQRTAWAYFSQFWLERYLSVTVDAAEFAVQGTSLDNELNTISDHVITFPNGTRGTVESIQPYHYKDRLDLEVRISVSSGPMRGKDVWTTAAELTDGTGHPYVKM